MSLKARVRTIGDLEKSIVDRYEPMARAGRDAIREIADEIKAKARADIAAAGFSTRWQNAFRVDVYPKRGVSLNAAAFVYHKIPYADIFETGGTIHGKPLLWIPLSSTPKKIGAHKMTADRYQKEVGKLFLVKRPGKNPLLFAKTSVSKGQAKSGNFGKVSLTRLRKGAANDGIVRAVPLFVGVNSVKIRDRFSIREIVDTAANRLAAVYLEKISKQQDLN